MILKFLRFRSVVAEDVFNEKLVKAKMFPQLCNDRFVMQSIDIYPVDISGLKLGKEFFHRIGHGLGREAHEDPSLDPGSRTVLEPGMVFTIEPGIYIAGWGGARIEDDVVVQENDCRVLTEADRSLRVIPST